MININQYLKTLDNTIRTKQPKTMDEFISLVFNVPNGKTYGFSFEIVKYMGYIQGVRVNITATKKTHTLPKDKRECYGVLLGLDDYIEAGWKVVNNPLMHLFIFCFLFTSCYTSGKCPTTNKKYFTKGVKASKPLYKGYPSQKGYKCR